MTRIGSNDESTLDHIWVCEECNHIFTEEQAHDEMHPCFGCGKSKKPWVCESFLAPFVEVGT